MEYKDIFKLFDEGTVDQFVEGVNGDEYMKLSNSIRNHFMATALGDLLTLLKMMKNNEKSNSVLPISVLQLKLNRMLVLYTESDEFTKLKWSQKSMPHAIVFGMVAAMRFNEIKETFKDMPNVLVSDEVDNTIEKIQEVINGIEKR